MFQYSFQHYLSSREQSDNSSIYFFTVIYLMSSICIPFLSDNIIFTLTSANKPPWKSAGIVLQKNFHCNVPKDTASSTSTFWSLLILPKTTWTSSAGWLAVSNGFMYLSNLLMIVFVSCDPWCHFFFMKLGRMFSRSCKMSVIPCSALMKIITKTFSWWDCWPRVLLFCFPVRSHLGPCPCHFCHECH